MWNSCRHDGQQLLSGWHIWHCTEIPSLPSLRELTAALRDCASQETRSRTAERHQAWSEAFHADWAMDRQGTYAYVRGENKAPSPLIQRQDGTYSGNIQEMDSLLQADWLPIFRMYSARPLPSMDIFAQRYSQYFPAQSTFIDSVLDAEALREILKKMKVHSAHGVDGWRVQELRNLPDVLLNRLCDLFRLVEETGRWPSAMTTALVIMIDKGGGLKAGDLRPITVTSIVYRLWAVFRVRQVLSWQESWASDGIFGFRRDSGTEDAFWQTALEVEMTLLNNDTLFGFSIDFSKAFDRVPTHIVFELGKRAGLPSGISRALEGMYAQLQRRFRTGKEMALVKLSKAPTG